MTSTLTPPISSGNQPPVTGAAPNFDSSTAGKAAALVYTPCVRTVMRQFGWDFARNTITLEQSGNAAPYPWTFEYLYPSNGSNIGVEVWFIALPKGSRR